MCSVSLAGGTNVPASPAKLFYDSTAHSSTEYNLEKRRGELCSDMHQKHTLLSVDDFWKQFVPSPRTRESARIATKPTRTNIFRGMDTAKNEAQMYNGIPKALNKSNLCAGYKFVATPRKSDKADLTRQSVDMGMYPTSLAPKRPADGSHPRMDWSTVEIPIECKNHPTQEDPFDDSALDGAPAAELRKAALGQILSYAELVFRYQQRSHLFLVYFLGDFVRLIFIDHGGLYVTHKLNYKEKGEKIAEFFWRYSRMTPTERGHDPTAVRVTHDSKLGQEMKRMAQPPKKIDERDYIRDMFKQSLDYKWPWWCLSVPVVSNEGTPEEVFNRKFLVGKPHFQAPGVAGRATRGYVALPLNYNDEVEGPFVYLKDAWRVAREGREREGSILAELNELKVQSVPTLVCHGDIPGQATISQKIWPAYHPDAEDCPLKLHQHYRLVVKEVGKPLDQFKNGFELVYALFCCIEAHEAAHEAGIIHRDISAGNILLWYNPDQGWHGLLNDWELSKRVPGGEAASGECKPDRTGTWQFLSALALNDHYRDIIVPDELEAFLHVLLYYAIRFLPHNCAASAVGKLLHLYFEDYTDGEGQITCGQMKYYAMKTGEIDLTLIRGKRDGKNLEKKVIMPGIELLRFHKPGTTTVHPIQTIVETLLRWFAAYYALDRQEVAPPQTEDPDPPSDDIEQVELPKDFFRWTDKYIKHTTHNHTEPSPVSTLVSEPNTGPTDPNADRVQTHAAMLTLLAHELRQLNNWPADDKGVDKRPKHGYAPPKDGIPISSTQLTLASATTGTSGTKRRREDHEENPKTPKRRSQA